MDPTQWMDRIARCAPGSTMPTTISRRRLLVIRVLAVSAFTAYIYSQIHVLFLPSPETYKPYSPNRYFLYANFSASALLNIYWLRQLFFKWDYAGDVMPLAHGWVDFPNNTKPKGVPFRSSITHIHGLSSAQVSCLPFHILGSIFLTAWGIAWVQGHFLLSQILVAANLCAHLYTVFLLLHVEEDEFITPINYLTHLVMKTNTGLAVLYLWNNWGFIDQAVSPTLTEMINSGVIFLLMTVGSGPDPTVGLCLLYDLMALALGQYGSGPWRHAFHAIMIVVCICLLVDLHLSEKQHFSWLKGFDISEDDDQDIERLAKPRTASWNESSVPPYFPYAYELPDETSAR